MSSIDTSLFLDIADALGISSPAIVEKDYWAIQFLKKISMLEPKGYRLVFSGGTCLAKAHQNTFRMSEDIDIKMVPHEEFAEPHLTQGTTPEKMMKPSFAMFMTCT